MRARDRKILPLLLAALFLLAACGPSAAGPSRSPGPSSTTVATASAPASPQPVSPSPSPAAPSPSAASPSQSPGPSSTAVTTASAPTSPQPASPSPSVVETSAVPAGTEEPPVAPTPTPSPSPSPSPTPAPTPTPTPKPEPAQPTCTISISCAILLDRLDDLDGGKRELVPEDGWLLPPTEVALEEGDSVFDLLLRSCRAKGIHMEFSRTPGLGSAYIEGIGNLYEFDCGDLSGWIFAVNGVSPNVSCSDAFPKSGDRIQWCYTRDLGDDLPHITRG